MIVESPTTHSNLDGPISAKFRVPLGSQQDLFSTIAGKGQARFVTGPPAFQAGTRESPNFQQLPLPAKLFRPVSRDAESLQEKRSLSPAPANLAQARRVYFSSRPLWHHQRPANTRSHHQRGRSQRVRATELPRLAVLLRAIIEPDNPPPASADTSSTSTVAWSPAPKSPFKVRAACRTVLRASDNTGFFIFKNLPAGSFKIRITATDLEPYESYEIILHARETRQLPIVALPIATATVNVRSPSPKNRSPKNRSPPRSNSASSVSSPTSTPASSGTPPRSSRNKSSDSQFVPPPIPSLSSPPASSPASSKRATPTQTTARAPKATPSATAPTTATSSSAACSAQPSSPRSSIRTRATSTRAPEASPREPGTPCPLPFICRGDNGRRQFNYSHILGNFAAGGISNLYRPEDRPRRRSRRRQRPPAHRRQRCRQPRPRVRTEKHHHQSPRLRQRQAKPHLPESAKP